MAQRLFNLGDASTPPKGWLDAQDASTLVVDSTTLRLSSWAFKGSGKDTLAPVTPYTAATAPLFNSTGFNAALPAVTFASSRFDLIATASNFGIAQPATLVMVWQEPAATRSAYEVVLDLGTTNGSANQTVFGVYGGTTPIYVIGSSSSVQIPQSTANPLGAINILVIEFNGANSRIYFNGVNIAAGNGQSFNFGASLFAAAGGLQIGGKKGDTPTAFNGAFGEFAVYPTIFGAGDMWDRITQGTMWKWGQQAKIPTGATYKTVAPMVDVAAATVGPTTGPAAVTSSSTSRVGAAAALLLNSASVAATSAALVAASVAVASGGATVSSVSAPAAVGGTAVVATGPTGASSSSSSQVNGSAAVPAGAAGVAATSASAVAASSTLTGAVTIAASSATRIGGAAAIALDPTTAMAGSWVAPTGSAGVAVGASTVASSSAMRVGGAAAIVPTAAVSASSAVLVAGSAAVAVNPFTVSATSLPGYASAQVATGAVSVAASSAARVGGAATVIVGAAQVSGQVSASVSGAAIVTPGPTRATGSGSGIVNGAAAILTGPAAASSLNVDRVMGSATVVVGGATVAAAGHADAVRPPIYPAPGDIVYAEAQTRIVPVEPVVAIVPVSEERDMLQWPDKWQSEERVFGIDWAALTGDAELHDLGARVLFGDIQIGEPRLVGTVHAVEVTGGSGPATVAFYVSTATERRIEQRVEILVKG